MKTALKLVAGTMFLVMISIEAKAASVQCPVYGGKLVEFDATYPIEFGPLGFVREGVLMNAIDLSDCHGISTRFPAQSRMIFAMNGGVTWWSSVPTTPGYCICGTKEDPCPPYDQ